MFLLVFSLVCLLLVSGWLTLHVFLEDSRASIMLYCPPVSCVGCCHHELWSRSCRVLESPCRFPLSVAISCQERKKVHRCTVVSLTEWSETHFQLTTGQCGSPEAEIETWGAFCRPESIWHHSLVCLVGWFFEPYVPMRCSKRWLWFRFEPCTQITTTVQSFEVGRIFKELLKRLHFFDKKYSNIVKYITFNWFSILIYYI